MFDKISAFVALIVAVAAYTISKGSLLVAIIAIVIVVMISRSLKSIFQVRLDKAFPPSEVFYIRGDNLQNQENLGLNVIVITEKLFFHTEYESDKNYILDLIDNTAEKIAAESDIFRFRYNYVIKHNLPYQSAYAACRNEKTSLKVVYKKWFDTSGVNKLGVFEDDKDSFAVDDITVDPRENTEHRTMVQFVFDPKLPLPDEKYE